MQESAPEFIGETPLLEGARCDELLVEQFVIRGEVISDANVLFAKFDGIWYRLWLDGGVVFWRSAIAAPEPWSVPEEQWEYPHVNVGRSNGLIGQTLVGLQIAKSEAGCRVQFTFAGGNSVVLEEANDVSRCVVI